MPTYYSHSKPQFHSFEIFFFNLLLTCFNYGFNLEKDNLIDLYTNLEYAFFFLRYSCSTYLDIIFKFSFNFFYATISQHFPKLIINRKKNQDTCTCIKNCKDIWYTLNLHHQIFCHLEPKLMLVLSKCKYSISYYGLSSILEVLCHCFCFHFQT